MRDPVCPYCRTPAALADSAEVYQRSYGPIWICRTCGAYVGCHPGTEKPLGRLADKELRQWKIKAHATFDKLWQAKMRRDGCSKGQARRAGYEWLAKQLRINRESCHIGMFDVARCRQVVEVCTNFTKEQNDMAAA